MAIPPLASTGIGSGLDVNAIVDKLMSIERRPLEALALQQAAFKSKISAFGVVKSALAALQTAVKGLTANGAFRGMSATISDTTLATLAAGSGAVAGSHSIEVTALAQAHKLASSGFATEADTVGSGTLTFTFGTWAAGTFTANASAATGTVTIGAGQSSLAGIRDAVNAAKVGVTATIVDDGSASGKRLVFTSSSGAAMSLKVGVTDDDGNALDAAGLSQLAYDPAGTPGAGRNLSQTVAAQNAALTIDGIAISKPTNVIADAIAGVTITVNKTNVGAPATITIASDPKASVAAVEAFVKGYNDLQKLLTNLTKYDPEQKVGSVLTGDATARTIQSRLRSLAGGTISGAVTTGNELASLSHIGIKSAVDGTLTLDSAKLSSLLASDPQGVERLFSALATSSDALVGYAGSSAKTQPGEYAVTVTQLATRGTLVGASLAGLTITAGVNDTLTAIIDGVSTTVTLSAQTYASADALAAEVAGRLNGSTALRNAGSSVGVTASGGVLTVTSTRYGSASNASFSGNAAATLVGAGATSTAGLDVAGTIGGDVATGSGKTLTAATATAAEGLKLTIEGGALGARGTVRFTRGIGSLFETMLEDLVDDDGLVASKTEGVQASVTTLDKRKIMLEARLERIEEAYRRQYIALDATIAQMSATSQYLTQQLANLPKPYDDGK
jgi:flagellar hook-associated protein 2